MNNSTYSSDKLYYQVFRYSFLFIAFVIFLVGLLGFFAPHLVSFNKNYISIDQAMVMMSISIIPLIIFLLIHSKFVTITIDENSIIIDNYNKKCKWNEVTINQIPFVFPPLYKLKVNEQKGFYLFNTENKYLWVSIGIIKDISSMGNLIKKTKSN